MDYYENFKQLAQNRKSHRNYASIPVSDEIIQRILLLSKKSPYASGKKNWDILVVKEKETIAHIADLVRQSVNHLLPRIREDFKAGFSQYAKYFSAFETAPVLLIPTFRINPSLSLMCKIEQESFGDWEKENVVKSIACVCMMILFSAESLGLGSCFMTGALLAEKELSQVLKLGNQKKIGAILPLGYPLKGEK